MIRLITISTCLTQITASFHITVLLLHHLEYISERKHTAVLIILKII